MSFSSSWPYSRQVVIDQNGQICPGAKAFFFQAGTTTPFTVYQDAALTIPFASPIVADGLTGRFPRVYIGYGLYREQVFTAAGIQLWNDDGLGTPAPVVTSDTTTPNYGLQTGDVVWSPTTGSRTSFVRLNGRTLGSASSGASEYAAADAQNLFVFLWENMPNALCPVTGGRGASGLADFTANKTLQLLDLRGGVLAGLDGMGNSLAGRLTSANSFASGGAADAAGSALGETLHTLTTAEIPAHSHTATATSTSTSSTTSSASTSVSTAGSSASATSTATSAASSTSSTSGTTDIQGSHAHTQYTTAPTNNGGNFTAGGTAYVQSIDPVGTFTTSTSTVAGHYHNLSATTTTSTSVSTLVSTTVTLSLAASAATTVSSSTTTSTATTVTVANSGGGGAHNNMPYAVLGTFYQKL